MDVVFAVGVYLAIGALVGYDASKRGMSGSGWMLATWCFFIVTIALYLVVRKPMLLEGAPAGAASRCPATVCSSCGKYFEDAYRFCPHCGAAREELLEGPRK